MLAERAGDPVARVARFPPTTDINPYQRLLYGHLSRYGIELAPDARRLGLRWLIRARRTVSHLHFHWALERQYRRPEHLPGATRRPPRAVDRALAWPRAAWFVAVLLAARMLGMRLVWTVHEVTSPDSPGLLDRMVARALAGLSHVLLVHDAATAERARRQLGARAASIELVPHGSYRGVYSPGRSRAAVRADLGIAEGSFVFLCFGTLRRYKRTDLLLEAFGALPHSDVSLVLAGRVREAEVGEAVARAAERDRRIVFLSGHVPDDRVGDLFAAADAFVLARADGGTSGSVILSASLGVPVVVADLPAYHEVLGAGAGGWFHVAGDRRSLRMAMAAARSEGPGAATLRGRAAMEATAALDWSVAAGLTAAAITTAI